MARAWTKRCSVTRTPCGVCCHERRRSLSSLFTSSPYATSRQPRQTPHQCPPARPSPTPVRISSTSGQSRGPPSASRRRRNLIWPSPAQGWLAPQRRHDAYAADRRGAEVGVAELALDDVQRQSLAGEYCVGVAQLVRCKPPADRDLPGETVQLEPGGGARPGAATDGSVDDAEQRPDRQLSAGGQPRAQLL